MKVIVVWVLLSLNGSLCSTSFSDLKFPEHVDCQRMAIQVKELYKQTHPGKQIPAHLVKCVKTKVLVRSNPSH